MNGCLLLPFTRAFSTTPSTAFLVRLGASIPTLSDIFVGKDWRFGRGGQAMPDLLSGWPGLAASVFHA